MSKNISRYSIQEVTEVEKSRNKEREIRKEGSKRKDNNNVYNSK